MTQKTLYKFEKGFKGCIRDFYVRKKPEEENYEEEKEEEKEDVDDEEDEANDHKVEREFGANWKKVDLLGEADEGINVLPCE